VHGVGGIIGALLTGVFAFGPLYGGAGGSAHQVLVQCYAIGATLIWSGGMSFILLKIIDITIGLRITKDEEVEGMDITLHGEQIV
jgi:Amt family ammonium transporter